MVLYAWETVLASLVLIPVAPMGWVYAVVAVVSGALFVASMEDTPVTASTATPAAPLAATVVLGGLAVLLGTADGYAEPVFYREAAGIVSTAVDALLGVRL